MLLFVSTKTFVTSSYSFYHLRPILTILQHVHPIDAPHRSGSLRSVCARSPIRCGCAARQSLGATFTLWVFIIYLHSMHTALTIHDRFFRSRRPRPFLGRSGPSHLGLPGPNPKLAHWWPLWIFRLAHWWPPWPPRLTSSWPPRFWPPRLAWWPSWSSWPPKPA